jgi:hypothetical protein
VPSFAEVTGHAFGERTTVHAEMVRYLEALAESSDRVSLVRQGHSWEGRELLAAVVTSAANQSRLDAIREASARLADPRRTSAEQADEIIASGQPVVVWLGGSIHGNELSGSEGLLKVLERLGTGDNPSVRAVLDHAVIIIDPMLNPDGRDAFAARVHERLGAVANPDRADWGNDFTRWESVQYRTGHYYFDTNRDWFAHTQRETAARAGTIVSWNPQVSVDAHEMGADSEFYFDPATEPYGPFFPSHAREWFTRFGQAYAVAFDRAGFEYKTREQYNYFYPGYTTSYSSYQGSVGMLYEQGTTRGLAMERRDGSVRSLSEALEHQYMAAWTAVSTAVERRDELLRDYVESRRDALADGRRGVSFYLIPGERNQALVAELIDLLRRNGIEVGRLSQPIELNGLVDRAGRAAGTRRFAAGTYVVDAAQPRNRLIRALLEPDVPLSEEFLAEARARVERDDNPRFYDITAWSLPLVFNIEAFGLTGDRDLLLDAGGGDEPAPFPSARPGYAYLIDGRPPAAAAALYHLLAAGHRAGMLLRESRVEGLDVPGGSVVVKVGLNEETVHDAVRDVAARYRLTVWGVDTGLAEPGFPSLGSVYVVAGRKPIIGLLAEGPVHGYSFGWAWYTLEEQYGVPVTVLRSEGLSDRDLSGYDVLVLPDLFSTAGLADALDEEGLDRLTRWVHDGGTLVTIGAATEFARDTLDLLDLRSWYETEAGEGAYRFRVPGAVLEAEVDTLSWLSAGYGDVVLPVLVNSDRVLLTPEGPVDSSRRAVADPNFRGYWRGANRLFLNAVLLGPMAP